ncbi:hypothetical protein ACHAXA_000567 [Cyclostephanos tholiformis]|uniref:Uncharacterized protein n=1 Tax=Cyclostephanos tholiformis TaxID=382380 RepID=A0ABD3SSV5_9STRA
MKEPMKIKEDIDAENVMVITRDQLEEMDGHDNALLYLSIRGRVYAFTAGSKFYGRDASRSFGTGCHGGVDRTSMDCLSESLEGLTAAEDDAEEDEGGLDCDITSVADQAGTEAETGQI